MVSSVQSRPNHYETLGLTPSASGDDIEGAYADFVARIRRSPRMHPRQVVELSREILAAYKTLRDPIKRREYDASLGLTSKLKRQRMTAPFIATTPEAPTQPGPDPQIREASPDSVSPPTDEVSPAPEPQLESQRPWEGRAERMGPFIAATQRAYEARPEPQHRPEAPAETGPEPNIVVDDEIRGIENDRFVPDTVEPPSGGKRVAVGLGAFAAIVALLAVLIWPWAANRTPSAPPARTAATGESTATRAQAPAQQALPVDEGAPQQADETDASASASVGTGDTGPVPTSTTNSAAADSSATNGAAETQPAGEPDSGAIASSPETAPAPPSGDTSAADPLAPRPPAVGAQSPATTIVQPVVRQAVVTPPPQAVNRSRPAKWISGGLGKADNAGGWFEGTVNVQFTVKPNGQVTGCRASGSSGNPALDARTCGLLEQRLLFSPALDSQGRAIATQMRGTYTWGRTQRQKPRR